MSEDEKWMNVALKQAIKAQNEGEVPVGAVLVKDGKLITKSHNKPISKNDATAHAEIEVIRSAGKKFKNYRLNETTIYVTLEPCIMCFGAMIHARVGRIVYGANDSKINHHEDFRNSDYIRNQINITGGVLQAECSEILQKFFKTRR